MAIPPADERAVPTTAPDWSAIKHDVFCPLCEYNLRGLIEPRCPECGYGFDWPEVLNPQRGLHPYLFEHHPERNWWSYWRTVRGACRPKRFWPSLHPTQPSRPRRVLLYGLVGAGLLLSVHLPFLLVNLGHEMRLASIERTNQLNHLLATPLVRQRIVAAFGSVNGFLDRYYPVGIPYLKRLLAGDRGLPELWFKVLLLGVAVPVAWAWLSLAALMLFQISMRRGRLKPIHLSRCALYCFDPSSWALLLLAQCLLMTLADLAINPSSASAHLLNADAVVPLWIIPAVVWSAWRMQKACKGYLRFSWPTGTVLATQVIAFLGAMFVLSVCDFNLMYRVFQLLGLA